MSPIKDIVNKIQQNIKENNEHKSVPLKKNLTKNINYIKSAIKCDDLLYKEFYVGEKEQYHMAVFVIDGLTNGEYVYEDILKTLTLDIRNTKLDTKVNNVKDFYHVLLDQVLYLIDVTEMTILENILDELLVGNTVLLFEGLERAIVIETRGWKDRGVSEPTSQTVVRGPRDSFNETLRTNTMLVRRRIKDKNLVVVNKKVGVRTKTDVAIVYMNGIADDDIVEEVKKRIENIKIDAILESGYIEQLIEDEPFSIFPTIHNTERPDSAASAVLDGRILIMVDGTPYVLIVPAVFTQFFQAAEDYYHRFYVATAIRIIRYLAFVLGLLTPSFYIAITTYHQEMLPTPLLISVAAQREGIPFPAFIEALVMEVTFEILREAGIRMPRAVGSAVTVVGGLVIGQAAVEAGIVSGVMVIVVSLTAISNLINPAYNYANSVRLLRFVFMVLGAMFGLYGISLGVYALLLHLCSLRSFGVPYMAPFAPTNRQQMKDAVVRFPLWSFFKRPSVITGEDTERQKQPYKERPKKPRKKLTKSKGTKR